MSEEIEKVARAIAMSIAEQDGMDDWTPTPDWDFTWAYLDQGSVDFRQIAEAALSAYNPNERLSTVTDAMREAGRAAWIRCIDNIPNDRTPDAFGEVYRAMREAALSPLPQGT